MQDGRDVGQNRAPALLAILPYIMLPMALAATDQTMVSTALPAIAGALGDVTHVSWIIVAGLVTGVVAAPVYGQLRDVHGSRRMMLIALTVFMAASLLCAVATSLPMLVLGRALQGLGGGGLMTLAQAVIGETIPPLERAKYQGYLAAVMVTATTAGPVIGGFLTTQFGWRSVFLFNLPVGAVAVALTLSGPSRPMSKRDWAFDYAGLLLFIGFIAPLLLALDSARALASANTGAMAVLLLISGLSLAGLVRQERRALYPLMPIHLIGQRTIWMSDALAACHGAAMVSMVTMLPLYLHVIKGAPASAMGLLLLPLMLGIGTGSMLTGRMVSRTGRTAIFPSIGLSMATVVFAVLALNMDQWSRTALTINLLLAGAAMGTVMGVVQVTVQSAAGGKALGAAAASVQISRSIGAALGTTLTGVVLFITLRLGAPGAVQAFVALFDMAGGSPAPAPTPAVMATIGQAFNAAFLTIAVFTAIGAGIAWTIPKRRL